MALVKLKRSQDNRWMYKRDFKGGVGGRGADNSYVLYTYMKMSKDKFNKMEKTKESLYWSNAINFKTKL